MFPARGHVGKPVFAVFGFDFVLRAGFPCYSFGFVVVLSSVPVFPYDA